MAVCLGSFIAFLCTCCVIFIICWFKIGRRLREIRNVGGNHTNYNFQFKLFILLSLQVRAIHSETTLFQTCMPIVFNIFPAASCFILSLAKVEVSDFPYVCAMIVTFAQICDPIFTIFFIAEYKNVFTRCLHKVDNTITRISSFLGISKCGAEFWIRCSRPQLHCGTYRTNWPQFLRSRSRRFRYLDIS